MSITTVLLTIVSQGMPKLSSRFLASSGYTLEPRKLGDSEEFAVWRRTTAERQDRAWRPIVAAAKAGHPREDVVALYEAIESLPQPPRTLLEVGCGGGYNSDLLAAKFLSIQYTGIDISEAMIEVAAKHYPDKSFAVGSAYELKFPRHSFDVVLDGVALLHMQGWREAVTEYARVARSHVVLHGLTLTDSAPTTEFAKYAYGQPSIELVFNREELRAVCRAAGLVVVMTTGGLNYDLKSYLGIRSVSETWVLARTNPLPD